MARIKFNYNSNIWSLINDFEKRACKLWTDALQISIQDTSARMRNLIESEISAECNGGDARVMRRVSHDERDTRRDH